MNNGFLSAKISEIVKVKKIHRNQFFKIGDSKNNCISTETNEDDVFRLGYRLGMNLVLRL
jgi:hypothetical protein